jgi:pyruvate/2-oxoglutarate/acetoin dehydrogenase E1 component
MPYAKNLEECVVPKPDTIIKGVRKVLRGVKL